MSSGVSARLKVISVLTFIHRSEKAILETAWLQDGGQRRSTVDGVGANVAAWHLI